MTTPWFDRQDVLELLARRVAGFRAGYHQNLALLGPEGMGKTTLLKRFLQERGAGAPPLICAYLDVGDEDNLVEWASRFVQTLLYALLRVDGIAEPPTRLAQLVQASSDSAPKATAAATKLLALAESGRFDEAYDRLWDLPQILYQETGHRVVLALDEFHRLALLPVREPFRALGRKIMVQDTTLYVLASSQPALARSVLREGLALLFGQFELIELGPLSELACLHAIRAIWPQGQEVPSLVYLLMQLAQGHPQRLDLLLRHLQQTPLESLRLDPVGAVLELLEILLLEPGSGLRKEFESRLRRLPSHRSRLFHIQVLAVVASGIHRRREIVEVMGRSPTPVTQALRILEEKQLVARQGVFCVVTDHLFRLWMTAAYPLLHGVGLIDSSQLKVHFRETAQAWLRRLLQSVGLSLKDRLIELLRRWGGEHVELDGRRVLLPCFSEVSTTEGVGHGGALMARGREGRSGRGWWILLWEGPLEEREARALVQRMRTQRDLRGYRKVIAGPSSPVDVNVRLILQQGRIRLWDLQILNRLLDLYGMPCAPVPMHPRSPHVEAAEVKPQISVPASGEVSEAAG